MSIDNNSGSDKTKKNTRIVNVSQQNLYRAINPNISSSKSTDGVAIEYWNSNDSIEDNAYPQMLLDAYNYKSSIHQNFINLKRSLLYGSGLVPTDDSNEKLKEVLNKRNKVGHTLDNIFFKICQDFPLFEQASLQVFYARNGSIEDVYYTDISKIRAESPDSLGLIKNFHLSNYWGLVTNKRSNRNIKYNDLKDATKIPAFNPASFAEGKQLMFIKKDSSGNNVYAVPSYSSGMKAIDCDYEISKYFLNKLQNGFLASQMITFFADLSEEQQDELVSSFKRKYSGSEGSPIMINFASSDTTKPEILGLDANVKDTLFTSMKDISQQEIAFSHGGHLALLGVDKGSSINGDSNKINVARMLFISSVIVPFQNIILESFNRIMEINGFGENALTVNNVPLPLTQPALQNEDTTRTERRKLLLDLPELPEDVKNVEPTPDNITENGNV